MYVGGFILLVVPANNMKHVVFPLHQDHLHDLITLQALSPRTFNYFAHPHDFPKMPKHKEKEDLGAKFASHWTASENANKPVPLTEIEAARAARRKEYASIAKEYSSLSLSITYLSILPPGNAPSPLWLPPM